MVAASIDEVASRLASAPGGPPVERGRALGPLTTYRVGGDAALFVVVESRAQVDAVLGVTAATGVDTLVVGRGSNLLVADAGFDGLAIAVGEGLADIEIEGVTVRAGAAAPLPVVARATVAAGLTGFEWAVGVPGSIGGAVRMNAGGHGSDMATSVRSATVADLAEGTMTQWSAAELDFGYRRSAIGAGQVVVDAVLELAKGDRAKGEQSLSEIVRWRREHQPGGQNAGSVFTNPEGDSAGRLIDTAGGKGRRVGSAAVSTKHANFIQVDPGGSADDVLALMTELRALVMVHHGVELEVETRLVGFGDLPW
ncbi:MAG: UDP-N-acetylmuramate dehydrogenase [Acidimicrobiia bacterium]|nr:UDP-N-acetylmuramate dehydrogenase [Acidimicrobiia bacterium]